MTVHPYLNTRFFRPPVFVLGDCCPPVWLSTWLSGMRVETACSETVLGTEIVDQVLDVKVMFVGIYPGSL